MATDSRIDRLEVAVDGLKGEVQNLRTEVYTLRSEVNSRFNTLLVVNIGLWVTTIGTLIGFFITR